MPEVSPRKKPLPASETPQALFSDFSHWQTRKVKIETESGWHTIEGKCLGSLVVHPTFETENGKKDTWNLTHEPTSLMIAYTVSENESMMIGEILWNNHCIAMRGKTKEEVLAKLPAWVINWARACRDNKRCMNYAQYKTEGK